MTLAMTVAEGPGRAPVCVRPPVCRAGHGTGRPLGHAHGAHDQQTGRQGLRMAWLPPERAVACDPPPSKLNEM